MSDSDLRELGERIVELRLAKQLKQTELAYEAGVSPRTLQRLEAGEVVKSDGLLKVLKCLDCLDVMMAALDSSGFSPYERLTNAGLKVSKLDRQHSEHRQSVRDDAPSARRKRRVRRPAGVDPTAGSSARSVHVQWPEDQQ